MMKTNYSRPYKNRLTKRTVPYHQKKVVFNVHLTKDLKAKHGIRHLPVRKDDTVIILRGKFAGITKRVTNVSFKKGRIQIEGVKTTKTDGTEIFHYIEPSNCMITQLGKIDEGRRAIIDRKVNARKAITEKTPEEA
jgi:ribosomal protein uL24